MAMGERIGRAIQRLRTEGMWLFSRSVAVLPYWFQYYVLEEIIRVVLRYVIRYRRRLIIRQLSDSFPEKSGREIVKICNDYYGTLAEMVVNTLTLAGMGDAERARRVTFRGAADMRETVAGRNVVVLTSHHGFWEYDSFASLWMTDHHLVVAYHSIKNEAMDDFYMRLRRHRFGRTGVEQTFHALLHVAPRRHRRVAICS